MYLRLGVSYQTSPKLTGNDVFQLSDSDTYRLHQSRIWQSPCEPLLLWGVLEAPQHYSVSKKITAKAECDTVHYRPLRTC